MTEAVEGVVGEAIDTLVIFARLSCLSWHDVKSMFCVFFLTPFLSTHVTHGIAFDPLLSAYNKPSSGYCYAHWSAQTFF